MLGAIQRRNWRRKRDVSRYHSYVTVKRNIIFDKRTGVGRNGSTLTFELDLSKDVDNDGKFMSDSVFDLKSGESFSLRKFINLEFLDSMRSCYRFSNKRFVNSGEGTVSGNSRTAWWKIRKKRAYWCAMSSLPQADWNLKEVGCKMISWNCIQNEN